MKTYRAGNYTDTEVRSLSQEIQKAANRADPYDLLQILHAEPDKLSAGMVVLADGTDWNPGSGAGLYRRSEANSAWVAIGGGGGGAWGSITGTLSSQTDLQTALDAKLDDTQLDTDGTLAANSDAKVASQKATKTYVDAAVSGAAVLLVQVFS